jgi:phosphomannomutase
VDYLGAKTIAVGRDARVSSPEIAGGFIRGARSQGALVHDIGMVGTDMLYYYAASRDLDGGAIVTASHNPKEWNGIKMVRKGAFALSGDAGIREIKEAVVAGGFADEPRAANAATLERDVREDYARHCLSFVDPSRIPQLKVVLDAGNGMGSVGAEAIFSRLPVETVRMYFEPDGRFPNHAPDPLEEANRREIVARVAAEKADLGIAWDGDADRCFFIDDTGEFVPGDFITAILGEAFCRRLPGSTVVYDVRASRAVRNGVEAAGGTAVVNRVGHAFMKKRMREENAVFGGEVSGHFYFRDNWYADNGMIPALLLLELLGTTGSKLSDLLRPIRERYHVSGEINSRVDNVEAALARIQERYADARLGHLDGLSVDYADWHFNVRPSNTEPLLRLNLEAGSREAMEARRDEVLALIRRGGEA